MKWDERLSLCPMLRITGRETKQDYHFPSMSCKAGSSLSTISRIKLLYAAAHKCLSKVVIGNNHYDLGTVKHQRLKWLVLDYNGSYNGSYRHRNYSIWSICLLIQHERVLFSCGTLYLLWLRMPCPYKSSFLLCTDSLTNNLGYFIYFLKRLYFKCLRNVVYKYSCNKMFRFSLFDHVKQRSVPV